MQICVKRNLYLKVRLFSALLSVCHNNLAEKKAPFKKWQPSLLLHLHPDEAGSTTHILINRKAAILIAG